MYKQFNIWLNNPRYFRYAFFITLFLSIFINCIIIKNNENFFIFYIFAVIFLGLGFYNRSPWILAFFTTLVVLCRFFLIQQLAYSIITFFIYLITYFLITFMSVAFMKNYQKIKEGNLELTMALAKALDSRDTYTLHHSENVAKYAVDTAKKMGLSKDICDVIYIGGLLHDIGKIGIPEYILTKPGKLTDDEYAIIKNHPNIGYEMIKHVSNFNENGILDIVLYHHERYDGNGYPNGLKGDQIPLIARIVAIADTFDAMTSRRVYRPELDLEYTLNEICKNKGTQFDPEITDVFLSLFQKEK